METKEIASLVSTVTPVLVVGLTIGINLMITRSAGGGNTTPPSGPTNMLDFAYAANTKNFRIFLMR